MTAMPPMSKEYSTRKSASRAVKRSFVSFSMILSLAAVLGAAILVATHII